MVLTSDQKGAVAEAAIAYRALRLGIGVSRPLADEFYDLVLDLDSRVLRVQCKWASLDGDVVTVRCHRNRRTAAGLLRQLYPVGSVDAFAAYCDESRECYFIPVGDLPPCAAIHLRVTPARNNQQAGIRWAKDFEFDAKLRLLGAVAQLGERLDGIQKATGSSPVGSTSEAAFTRRLPLF
jgi:PD-(D/E)XK endonuclease